MIPGQPQLLTCPYCGAEKEVMSLISGNTCGAQYWSDNKMIAPMLPEVSYVQKCPQCGKYYKMGGQEEKFSDKGYTDDQGLLTYAEMKEAFVQLSEEGFVNEREEVHVRMMLHHAHNDYYYRSGNDKAVSEEDYGLFHENAIWLIHHAISDDVMKAEFYREIGDMDEAKKLIESVETDDDFLNDITNEIRKRLNRNDSSVFKIK